MTPRRSDRSLVGNVEGRVRWLELLKAVNECLPPYDKAEGWDVDIKQRSDLHITNIECQYVEDTATWFKGVKSWYQPPPAAGNAAPGEAAAADAGGAAAGAAPAGPPAAPPPPGQAVPPPAAGQTAGAGGATPAPGAATEVAGPKGAGWIVRLGGHHYHNEDQKNYGAQYVIRTLIAKLQSGKVKLPAGPGGGVEEVTLEELGVTYPVLVTQETKIDSEDVVNPSVDMTTMGEYEGSATRTFRDPNAPKTSPAKAAETPAQPGGPGGLGMPKVPDMPARGATKAPAPAKAITLPGTMMGRTGVADADLPENVIRVPRFDFVVHFCWQPKSASERAAARQLQKPNTLTQN